jgi:hypothetical protein
MTMQEDATKFSLKRSYELTESAQADYIILVQKYTNISPATATRLALEHPLLPQFGDSIDNELPLYATNFNCENQGTYQQGGTDYYRINVQVEFLNYVRMENNFLCQVRCGLNQTTTCQDLLGQMIAVNYTYPDATETTYQTATAQKMLPSFEVRAIGIAETNNPFEILNTWMNKTNLDTFQGFGPNYLLCTEVTYEAHNLLSNPKKYKFAFTFSGTNDGWSPLVYFVDTTTGKTPTDVIQGEGYKNVTLYQGIYYNNTYPFNFTSSIYGV